MNTLVLFYYREGLLPKNETSFVYQGKRGFFMLSRQKSGKSEHNKGKSGLVVVDRLL